jgi:3-phosphoshikimate 1-carboxyvinyltransferase
LEHLDLAPIRRVGGTVRLPGSKSISNRTLLLAALASGVTRIRGLLESDDTRYMLEALAALGISCATRGSLTVVRGADASIPKRHAELFLGNAGTAFRPLTAVLALTGGEYILKGTARMHERPIGDLVEALRMLGARIDYVGAQGFPPLAIHPGSPSTRTDVAVRGDVSSQFVSALLMALPLRATGTELRVQGQLISRPYVSITANLMQRFGVSVESDGQSTFRVPAGARYASPGEIQVEGDASSASYFLAAGAIGGLTGGSKVKVEGVGRDSIQGDVEFVRALREMGADIEIGDSWIAAGASREAIRAGHLKSFDMDLNHIPDAAMTLAVTALFASGPSTLRNIGSWRVKETDRLAAMATELRKLGATATVGPDWLRIEPPPSLRPASIDTYDDHRIAMSFSLAALGGIAVRINDPGCVAKTFPGYFAELARIAEH